MNCQVYLSDGSVHIGFGQSLLVYDEIQYALGDGAISFSSFPEHNYRLMLGTFRSEFLFSVEKRETEEAFLDKLKEYVKITNEWNPYFNFYMEEYVRILLCLWRQKGGIPDILRNFISDGGFFSTDGVNFADIPEASLWAAGLLLDDVRLRKSRLEEDYEAIAGEADGFSGLAPMQRLNLLAMRGRRYLSGGYMVTLKPGMATMEAGSGENDLMTVRPIRPDNSAEIVEMADIETFDGLLGYEMFHTLKSNLIIRRCRHCGEFFIVRGRIDTEYCDKVKDGETKPCSIIGATRSYWGSKDGDEVYAEFQKAYKRNHSRRRVGKMSRGQFYEWSSEARKMRDDCEAGNLTLSEFKAWLGNTGTGVR